MTLADVAREEAAHATAAEALGRHVELVQLGPGPRNGFTRLAPHAPAATIAEALRDCTIRLVGPALAGPEVASFPAFPGEPVDDLTAAQLIADRVCDWLSATLAESDRLIAQAERAAELLVGNETFQAATKRVAAALTHRGALSGPALREQLVDFKSFGAEVSLPYLRAEGWPSTVATTPAAPLSRFDSGSGGRAGLEDAT